MISVLEAARIIREGRKQAAELEAQYGWAARFWSWVDIRSENECWPWLGSNRGDGQYGQFLLPGRRNAGAHTVAYSLAKGPLQPGLEVCHTCDNRPCCNPAHLWLGTRSENLKDAFDKGRLVMPKPLPGQHARGEAVAKAVLTEAQVRSVLASGESSKALARALSVSDMTIRNIRKGVTWKHVERTP